MKKYVREAKDRAEAARNFPVNTCGNSRWLALIADQLAGGKIPPWIAEDPQRVAHAIYVMLGELWERRGKP